MKILAVFGLLLICFSRTTAQSRTSEQIAVDSLNQLCQEKLVKGFAQAKELADLALKLSDDANYHEGHVTALSNLAVVHLRNGNNKEAIKHLSVAVRLYNQRSLDKDTREYGLLFLRFGVACMQENDFATGLPYLQNAVSVAINIRDERLMSAAYEELGNHYTLVKNADSSLYYYQLGLKYAKSENQKAVIFNNLGEVYFNRSQFHKALSYYQKGYGAFRHQGATTFYHTVLLNIGLVYFMLENNRLALAYMDSAEHYARRLSSSNDLMEIYVHKSEIFQRLGNADSTAHYFRKIIVLKDSVYNDTYKKEFATAKVKMEVYQKEAENKLLLKDQRIAKLYLNLAVIGFILLTSFLAIFITRNKLQAAQRLRKELGIKVEERTQEIYRASLQLKLALNRARVNSHFVFNVLNSIRYMVLLKEPLRASDHLAKLSSLMRYSLETSQLEGVPIQAELNMLEQYIQLERTRLDNKFNYRITANVGDSILIPGMLIQPYVENAIIHGIGPTEGNDLYLSLHIRQLGDILRVKIEDNGKGLATPKSNDHTPMGASLGTDRLQILSLLDNKEYNVQTKDLYNGGVGRRGTVVILDLPVLKHQHNPVEAAS